MTQPQPERSDSRRRPSFRMVYKMFDTWHWHANMTHRNTPPRSWTNRAGNSRFRAVAWLRVWAAWVRLRIGVER